MFERKFGIRAYDYWWGYTIAQIELMAIDQPLVSYKDKDRIPSKEKMERIAKQWAGERAGRKSLVGKEINLGEFLNNK